MVRFVSFARWSAVLLAWLVLPASGRAQDFPPASMLSSADTAQLVTIAPPMAEAVAPRPRRPAALLPLYLSFGVLQGLDAHSTSRALGRGAVEANPVMKAFGGN